ncbi:MAG: PIG-L family deacetylase [Microthrixaceae bacterium]
MPTRPTPARTVVFVHAHPDDEAIFTGGTIAMLSRAGDRAVVVFTTSGELGRPPSGGDGRGTDGGLCDPVALRSHRRIEAERAGAILGVHEVVFLDHVDSGLGADSASRGAGAFVDVSPATVAAEIAAIARRVGACALVTYDEHGVYGHPDHIHVHLATMAAAALASVPTTYLATVDREYLHFVETHVVARADDAIPTIRRVGTPTVEVTTELDVRAVIDTKRSAIAAHHSQVGDDPSMGVTAFEEVYGFEWYVRIGPRGILDDLAERVRAADPHRTPRLAAPDRAYGERHGT